MAAEGKFDNYKPVGRTVNSTENQRGLGWGRGWPKDIYQEASTQQTSCQRPLWEALQERRLGSTEEPHERELNRRWRRICSV